MKPIDPKAFDELMDQAADSQQKLNLDTWIAGKESVYEDRLVRHVVSKLGLASYIPGLVRDLQEVTGDKEAPLTFNWFHENWPTFPVRLATTSWAKAHEVTVADLFKRLTGTFMYKKYMDTKELVTDEETSLFGLIFPWNHLGKVIIHNHKRLDVEGTRVVRAFANGEIVYLDILESFLKAVVKTWSV